ncbi:hypothetical protein H113_06544 [Trichophyton rubrum MR1459]|uniref:Uncharacterized protein n=1 Tax=Trichophyton rubrum CBS 288.86 TaxID=1215330 RepID=A0A022VUZ9_TRIRU|nr:hypothetical protein H102_06474 [Trichophyton rubrum CBS 100081]EZF50062.1 hypothetical protein H103_06501 [Trichophyton rubrum CBS 288.86]EZF92598.1 hypothetical protein H113_06544 [Trichophyton rubrum MR1459]
MAMEEALARHDRFGEDFSKVFTIINSAEIPAVENSALYLFVGTSRTPDEASKYVRVSQNTQSSTLEETLHLIHEELKILSKKMTREDPMNSDPEIEAALYERDCGRCFITGRTAGAQRIYIIPPSILKDKDLQPGRECSQKPQSYGAFDPILFSPWIFEIIKSPYLEPPYLPTDALKSKNGGWWLQPIAPQLEVAQIIPHNNELYKVQLMINFISHPLPAHLLLKTHRIVSHPLHTIYIEEHIKAGWPVEPGLVLKKGRENTENEAKALTVAEQYISISTPRFIDSFMVNKTSGFILMTKVVGRSLSSILHRITWEELEQIGKDLANFITELRLIPNTLKYLIADTRGGPVSDHRFFYQTWGPFKTVSGFTDRLLQDVNGARDKPPLSFLYEKKHKV